MEGLQAENYRWTLRTFSSLVTVVKSIRIRVEAFFIDKTVIDKKCSIDRSQLIQEIRNVISVARART